MMYMSVNRLDAERFARLEFTVNFGVEMDNRKLFTDFIQNGGSYENAVDNIFSVVPTL